MIGVVLEDQRLLLDDGVALLADVLAEAASFLAVMARATQVPAADGGRRATSRGVEEERKSSDDVLTDRVTAAQKCYYLLGFNRVSHRLDVCVTTCFTSCHAVIYWMVIRRDTNLPAFLTKPTSASTAWQMSQQKQSGCQLLFMALMTRPMMNSPKGEPQVRDQPEALRRLTFILLVGTG